MANQMKAVAELADCFEQSGFQIRIVGGAVRDMLLGVAPKDIDMCTDATPDEMKEIAKRFHLSINPLGEAHGTMLFNVFKWTIEVTTLRIDVETDGRHAEVEFTRDFEADAARRDLTINAMSMSMDFQVFDFFDGISDLGNKRLRFVGNADERIKEDFLRILRFFRMADKFDDAFWDNEALDAITENAEGLAQISVERVWMEMKRILASPKRGDIISAMWDCGVLDVILPFDEFSPHEVMGTNPMDATTALTLLVPEVDKLHDLCAAWKLSGSESMDALFIASNRGMTVQQAEDFIVCQIPASLILQVAMVDGNPELTKAVNEFVMPIFPVTGKDLIALGFKEGPNLGRAMATARQEWFDSRFTKNRKDLLNSVAKFM